MPTMRKLRRERLRERLAHGVVLLAFLMVPLAAWPRFFDQFTSVKWYVLEVVAVVWLLVERVLGGSSGTPAFIRRTRLACAALAALIVLGAFRRGPGWALEPLLARAAFVLMALASFWYFRRTGLRLQPLRAGVTISSATVIVLGLLQFAGARPLPWLTAGDQLSATFGNVNMAAQFVGLALIVLLSGHAEARDARRHPLATSLLALPAGAGLAYLHLLRSRSVPLALTAALLFLLIAGRRSTLLRAATSLSLLITVLRLFPGPVLPVDPGMSGAYKWASARLRLAVWSDTLRLIRDHPLGVGAGGFEQAFIPYALGGRSRFDESLVYRSPHNDYLRALAEEGAVTTALAAALLLVLVKALHRSPTIGSWRSPPGLLLGSVAVFLAIEALFQFPCEMAFPALVAAVMLGLSWACVEPPATEPPPAPSGGGWIGWALVAAGVLWALGRVATAEYLSVNARGDVEKQEHACRLDPRRLEACLNAAWLRITAGDHQAGRRTLEAVLARAPHYFPALKLLAEDALARGDRETGCRQLEAYDRLFDGRSSVRERVEKECPLSLRSGP
jgi:O-antigen ligase